MNTLVKARIPLHEDKSIVSRHIFLTL